MGPLLDIALVLGGMLGVLIVVMLLVRSVDGVLGWMLGRAHARALRETPHLVEGTPEYEARRRRPDLDALAAWCGVAIPAAFASLYADERWLAGRMAVPCPDPDTGVTDDGAAVALSLLPIDQVMLDDTPALAHGPLRLIPFAGGVDSVFLLDPRPADAGDATVFVSWSWREGPEALMPLASFLASARELGEA